MISKKTKLDHYTVGWNMAGDLVIIPVLKSEKFIGIRGEEELFEDVVEDLKLVSERRKTCIFIADQKQFELDENGNKEFSMFVIQDGIVKIDSELEAGYALKDIKKIIAEKEEDQKMDIDQSVINEHYALFAT